jgi:hypothetical protein
LTDNWSAFAGELALAHVDGDLVLLHQAGDALVELGGDVAAALDDLSRSKPGFPADRPYSSALLIWWNTSAERSSALVGMQPQLRQMPPSFSRSTIAVFRPSCAARIAAT